MESINKQRSGSTCGSAELGVILTKNCSVCSAEQPSKDVAVKLKNPEHIKELRRGLHKQYKDGRYLDAAIHVDSEVIRAHAFLVSAFSNYISAVFQYTQQLAIDRSIDLDPLSSDAVKALLGYAYQGCSIVPCEALPRDVLEAADFLCVWSVTKTFSNETCLEFNETEFLNKLLRNLCDIHKRRELTDSVIPIGALRIRVHKSVLSSVSTYFDKYFIDNVFWITLKKEEYFQSLQPTVVAALVDFAYTGELVVRSCFMLELIRAAGYLGFDSALSLCYDYLFGCLTAENCLAMYKQAVASDNETITKDIKRFILHHISEVLYTDEFLNLDANLVLEFLEDNELTVMRLCQTTKKYFFIPPHEQELAILQFVNRYFSHNSLENCKEKPRFLMRGVRLPLIDQDGLYAILEETRRGEDFSGVSSVIKEIIENAIKVCVRYCDPSVYVHKDYSPAWRTRRMTSRVSFSSLKVTGVNQQPASNQCRTFDHYCSLLQPGQYVTGMMMYRSYYRGKPYISRLDVTCNNEPTMFQVIDYSRFEEEPDEFFYEFNLKDDADVRITTIRCQTHAPETHLIHRLGFETNTGESYGDAAEMFKDNETFKPQGSLYLSYLTGTMDKINRIQSIIDLSFVWATDNLSRK